MKPSRRGATSIQFDQTVFAYVENFRGFPVGTAWATTTSASGDWVGQPDGLVVGVVAVFKWRSLAHVDGSGGAAFGEGTGNELAG